MSEQLVVVYDDRVDGRDTLKVYTTVYEGGDHTKPLEACRFRHRNARVMSAAVAADRMFPDGGMGPHEDPGPPPNNLD
jgi:hypothetical protein